MSPVITVVPDVHKWMSGTQFVAPVQLQKEERDCKTAQMLVCQCRRDGISKAIPVALLLGLQSAWHDHQSVCFAPAAVLKLSSQQQQKHLLVVHQHISITPLYNTFAASLHRRVPGYLDKAFA